MRLNAICRAFFIIVSSGTTRGRVVEMAIMGRPPAVLYGRFVPVRGHIYSNRRFLSVNNDLTERLVERHVVHKGNYMEFAVDTVLDADDRKHTRDVVLHPGAVTIVAILADRQVLLVRQYRHAAGEALLELPAGTLDRQPDGSIEDRLVAAKRELTEETSYRAGKWRQLSTFFTAPGFASELMTMFLATEISEDPDYKGPDPDERLELEKMPFADALALARNDQIRDAKTIIGLFEVDALARAGEVPELS
jgi:ADP-ribose pyrophosphatase